MKWMADNPGIEPGTTALTVPRSTAELVVRMTSRIAGTTHVFGLPSPHHGVEPHHFLPSLDERVGVEPTLLVEKAGFEPATAGL